MIPQKIDRKSRVQAARALLKDAQVSPRGMTALYLLILLALNFITVLSSGSGPFSTFIYILASLMSTVLSAGFVLYCMAVSRGERSEYLTLFDGFSFVGRLIGLYLLTGLLIGLWATLFLVPGILAFYRYRFAPFNLYENPDVGILGAMAMSQRQTAGYKGQLFALDLSFLGWTLLAALPSLVQDALLYQKIYQVLNVYLQDPSVPPPLLNVSEILIFPGWVWTLIAGVWALGVSVFYLARYRCTELSYFETAKSASGVGFGAVPPDGPSLL